MLPACALLCCCTVQEKRIKEKCMLSISMCAYNSFQLLKTPFASPPPFDPSAFGSLYSSSSSYFFFFVLFRAMYKQLVFRLQFDIRGSRHDLSTHCECLTALGCHPFLGPHVATHSKP